MNAKRRALEDSFEFMRARSDYLIGNFARARFLAVNIQMPPILV